jgi:hypothetical protein
MAQMMSIKSYICKYFQIIIPIESHDAQHINVGLKCISMPGHGHRQKRTAEDGDAPRVHKQLRSTAQHPDERHEGSVIAGCLLRRWAWGELSAVALQDISHCMKLSGSVDADIEVLAGLGAHGTAPGNVHRDLMRLCKCNRLGHTHIDDTHTQYSIIARVIPIYFIWQG